MKENEKELVFEVTQVTLNIEKTNPPTLVIIATGSVNTSGWSNGELNAFVYVTPPADGIYEFNFVAEPPTGVSAEVISAIIAESFRWNDFPKDLKGVKVYASNNSIKVDLKKEDK